ncbi:hypothetical protein [Polynucleobacter sp. Nonnen-W13]|uniref:hypothetical protein n=1 Tax=Polynucleobacter sp. Nonnen-W13 TaxID=1855625 RepID=UPI001C0C3384|nr:hypothetical protein [Polynucleobacter sp. Nonnen-W13]MBU3558372.1 hypothetical protein [Polynucleobacter sp. Nonnen-W13]
MKIKVTRFLLKIMIWAIAGSFAGFLYAQFFPKKYTTTIKISIGKIRGIPIYDGKILTEDLLRRDTTKNAIKEIFKDLSKENNSLIIDNALNSIILDPNGYNFSFKVKSTVESESDYFAENISKSIIKFLNSEQYKIFEESKKLIQINKELLDNSMLRYESTKKLNKNNSIKWSQRLSELDNEKLNYKQKIMLEEAKLTAYDTAMFDKIKKTKTDKKEVTSYKMSLMAIFSLLFTFIPIIKSLRMSSINQSKGLK